MEGKMNKLFLSAMIAGAIVLGVRSAQADTFTFTSCEASSGCVAGATYGTVTLTQVGSNVNVTVDLTTGTVGTSNFVETQAGGGEMFLFNSTVAVGSVTGVTLNTGTPAGGLSGFTNISPAVVPDGGTLGSFNGSIECTVSSQCNGNSGGLGSILSFTINSATLAQLETANAAGVIFLADIAIAMNGSNTGTVDVSVGVNPVPLPGAFLLFGTVLAGGLGVSGLRKRRQRGPVSVIA
jgi:hypothetical protein